MAVFIISISVAALLDGLITSTTSSATHRSLTTIEGLLKSFAETAKYDIQSQTNPDFNNCATASYYEDLVPPGFTIPPGYSVNITSVEYWGGHGWTSESSQVCESQPQLDYGIQLIDLLATAPNNVTETMSFVVTGGSVEVSQVSPFLMLRALSPVVAGTPFVLGATLSGGAAATGTIVFTVFGPQASPPDPSTTGNCTSGGTVVGTAPVAGDDTYTPTSNFTPDLAGTYWWYASYSGDTYNSPTATGCGSGMPKTQVQPASPQQLVFTTQPGGGTAGAAWAQQPVVTIEDAYGNVAVADSNTITVSITNSPSGVTLSGCSATTTAGVASFSGCVMTKVGSYTLTATDSTDSLTATSAGFNVTAGQPQQLLFTTQPRDGTGGTAWAQQPVVTIEDVYGNTVTSDTNTITLAITTGTPTSGGPGALSGCSATTTGGVATFSGCVIDKAGNGYTLTATDSSDLWEGNPLTAESNSFNIAVGPASQLLFTTQPVAGRSGAAFTAQPKVTVEDAGGNVVTSPSVTITLTPSGGTLSGCTQSETAGVVSFAGCTFAGTVGTSYTLTASSGSLTPATSSTFSPTAFGAAYQLVFTTQPGGGITGKAWPQQPVVTIEDSGGNTVTSDTNAITLAYHYYHYYQTLSCSSNPVSASSGVATFSGCEINSAGTGYTLRATDSSDLWEGNPLTAESNSFNITGAANKLVYTTAPPTSVVAGTTFPVVVAEEDSSGNTLTWDSTTTVSLSANGGGFSCTTAPTMFTNGVATFSGCSFTIPDATYTVTASHSPLTPATATTTVTGPASKLVFTTQPGGGTGGMTWSQQPVVTIEDSGGKVVASDTNTITLAITTGTPISGGPGALSGCGATMNTGVVTFSGCEINTAGTGYSLTASDSSDSLTANSGSFNIAVGPASKLVFTTQPGGGTGGTAWSQQPVVTIEDAGGNTVTSDTNTITLAIYNNPSGGTLSGCSATTTAGVATFSGCEINTAGTGYTLRATDTSDRLTATSAGFNVTAGQPQQLLFTTQPGGGTGGTAWAQQPVVTIEDAGGNTVTSDTNTITLAITTGTPTSGGPGALSGCSATTTAGVATFSGCEINTIGTGYTLTASDSSDSLTANSGSFDITGAASKLVYTTAPPTSVVARTTTFPVVVAEEDSNGNILTWDSTTTVSLSASGGGFRCTTSPATFTNGVATFSGCYFTTADATYTVTASHSPLTPATATTTVTGPASKLVFTTQPRGGTTGTAWTAQPVVTIEDSGSKVVASDTNTITLAITTGTPTSGGPGVLSGCSATTTAGVATFSGCEINTAGTGYTLTASDSSDSLTANSGSFDITGAASKLVYTTAPPTSVVAGTTFPVTVAEEDSNGNTLTWDSTTTVSLSASGGGFSCTTAPTTFTNGVATFSGCSFTIPDATYTVTASHSPLTPATATTTVTGPASQLVFTTQPVAGASGSAFTTQPVVTVEDSGGNTVASSSATVTLTASGGTLASCAGLTASSGVVTVRNCTFAGKVGTNYTLTAASGSLAPATSSTFSPSTFGPASQLVFTTQPANGGTTLSPQPVVTVEDSGGNTVTSSPASVTLAIYAYTGGTEGTLSCATNPVNASAGVATFAGCTITGGTATYYTLEATASGLATATTGSFRV